MAGKNRNRRNVRGMFFLFVLASVYYFTATFSLNISFQLSQNSAVASDQAALEKLVSAANKEGRLMWYESSPDAQFAKIEKGFNEKYPKIKLEHVRLRGADVGTRIIAESQANASSADVVTTGLEILSSLSERGLLMNANWQEIGIPKNLIATPFALISMASTYCLDYNTNLVSEQEAPKTWEDVLDPKWKGKIGIWQKPAALALLTPAWGEEKTLDFAKKLSAQDPVFYQSNFPLNNALAAGEISIGITIYHTATPTLKKGGPIKLVFPNPIPYEPLCSSIPSKVAHPNAAKLFLSWLLSFEGSRVYENATSRGNPWIPGTDIHEMLKGKELSSFTPEQSKQFSKISKEIEKILMKR